MRLPVYDACGNVFALLDARQREPRRALADLARELPPEVDGLVVVRPPHSEELFATVLFHNRDGGRPEACGNGLRSAAAYLFERDGCAAGVLGTDAGPRRFEVAGEGGRILACVSMGRPTLAGRADLSVGGASHRLVLVSMGNPHAILFVPDPAAAPVEELGGAIEVHPRFPERTNVGFCAVRSHGLVLRVWERGVGETRACGTGACAAAVAAEQAGHVRLPVPVEMPGGRLDVGRDGVEMTLAGPTRRSGEVEVVSELQRGPAGGGRLV